MDDPIFALGGLAFIGLSFLSLFNRDLLWKLYTYDRSWKRRNPERTPAWERKSQRLGLLYLIVGVVGVVLGF